MPANQTSKVKSTETDQAMVKDNHPSSRESEIEQNEKQVCQRSKLRVLVVEDNEINQRLANIMLTKLGIASSLASDGHEAISIAMAQEFDLIFMDIKMPKVDGISATQAILGHCERQPIIIAMTANIFEQDIQTYHDVGMLHVVSKPFKINDFSAALEKFFILK